MTVGTSQPETWENNQWISWIVKEESRTSSNTHGSSLQGTIGNDAAPHPMLHRILQSLLGWSKGRLILILGSWWVRKITDFPKMDPVWSSQKILAIFNPVSTHILLQESWAQSFPIGPRLPRMFFLRHVFSTLETPEISCFERPVNCKCKMFLAPSMEA